MESVPAIAVRNLRFHYPGEKLPAVDDITLSIDTGSCFGLLGPNGAGKSTLLALLTGILLPQHGDIRINGERLSNTRKLHEYISLVPQDYAFYPTLTLQENLDCFAGFYGLQGAHKRARIDFAVQVCGLDDLLHQRASSCSGGVRRRLNLALGLLNQPELLFLDEPTVGIDAQSRHFILESIAGLQRAGMTIIYTSHYMEEIQSICDAIAIIDHGKLLVQDSLANILARAADMPALPARQNAQRLEDFLSLADTPRIAGLSRNAQMTALIATIKKELLLLLRDIHGLLLLFVMPVAFILIMSLALQSQFAQNAGGQKIAVLVDDQARSDSAASVIKLLEQRDVFSWHVTDTLSAPEKIRHDEAAFLLTLQQNNNDLHAEILVAPATNPQIEAIFTAVVGEAMSKQRIEALLRNIKMKRALDSDFSLDDGIDEDALNSNPVTIQYSYQKNQTTSAQPASAQPTSVQQSVPAWLVFAMFFSVVPLANTLISERQQGTLRRLRTLPVSLALPVIGKLVPYFVINQIQVLLMLTVGVYLMPLFGADSLTLGHSLAGLLLMSVCLSIAALGYGILIAVVARTTDQATTLGGVGNILLAALGGIMVPRFVMPDSMQQIAGFSPMAWGLEGFLDIFLRSGGVKDVLPEAGSLFLFGAVTIALALVLFRRNT